MNWLVLDCDFIQLEFDFISAMKHIYAWHTPQKLHKGQGLQITDTMDCMSKGCWIQKMCNCYHWLMLQLCNPLWKVLEHLDKARKTFTSEAVSTRCIYMYLFWCDSTSVAIYLHTTAFLKIYILILVLLFQSFFQPVCSY